MSLDPERRDPHDHDDELVPEDDAIIGRALRGSLMVVAALAVTGGGLWWLLSRPGAQEPTSAIEAAAPLETKQAADAALPALRFTDVTTESGLRFVHQSGATGDKFLPESMGSGAAFVDVDGDDDPDLVLANGDRWPKDRRTGPHPTQALYLNDGAGKLTEATAPWGLDRSFYGTGVAAADLDGDDRPELFFTAVGPDHLFRHTGGHYEEITDRAGVGGPPDGWSAGAAFFDADGDGDLDLFVCNYVRWSESIDLEIDYRLTGVGRAYGPPVNYQGTQSRLYRNDGGLRFTDVSAESGIEVLNPATGAPVGKALTVLPVDVERDGDLDLFVANDTVQNFLFHNRGDGTFDEVAELWGLAYDRNGAATGAMGVDAADYRNDGSLGFLVGNFANEMTSLYVTQGDPTLYADEAITEGIGASSRTALSFGVLLFDADLDGRLDLVQSNGHLEDQIATVDPSQSYQQAAQLFWNAGGDSGRSFELVPPDAVGDLSRPIVGRAATTADLDGDGDLDLLLTQVGGPPLLLRNEQATGHHWARLRLVGKAPNRDAIGARVELTAGGVTQVRQLVPTRSYLSQVELPLTFGLAASTKVDRLVVTWPDGTTQEVEEVAIDRLQRIEQPGAG